MTESDKPLTGIYEILDALEAIIKATDPQKRNHLAETIDAYAEDFPDEYYWALGGQAPAMLHMLLMAIDAACRESKPPPRRRPGLN
jgi:hypothetical protein